MEIVEFSERSREDILSIWAHVAAQNSAAADAVLDGLEGRCAQLADFPELGPRRRDISGNARVLVFERWLIVYEIVGERVIIARIVDGARDLSSLNLSND